MSEDKKETKQTKQQVKSTDEWPTARLKEKFLAKKKK